MQHSKSHHWVPQFYLRHWTDGDGRLVSFVHDSDRNFTGNPTPRFVVCEDHLYTVFTSDENHIYGEESIFKTVDQDGAVALDAALGPDWKNLSPELTEKLFRFIYLLAARHPSVRDGFIRNESTIFAGVRADLEAAGMHEYAARFFGELPKYFETTRDRATLSMLLIAAFDRFAYKKIFFDSPRIFLETKDRAVLLTSDHPFTSAPTIGDEAAIHYFPLSPQRGLLLSRDENKLKFIQGLGFDALVSFANLLTVLFANKCVYSNIRMNDALILEHLGGAYRYDREQFSEIVARAFSKELTLGLIGQ